MISHIETESFAMTFEQLYYFSKIYEKGSINSAANACFISYQAMSKSLKKLEQELDMPLFVRTHAGVSFTPEGHIFYEDCQKILQMRENWSTLSRQAKKTLQSKNMRLLAVPFISDYIFPDLIPKLEQQGYRADGQSVTLELLDIILESTINHTRTIGLTCYLPPFPSNIAQLAEVQNWEICHLFSDTFLVYMDRNRFHALFGETATAIDAAALWELPYADNASLVSHLTPYAVLQNPALAKYKNYGDDIFNLLREEELYAFMHASIKERIEDQYPYMIGVPVEKAPPLRIDYYMVYSQMTNPEDQKIIELIKEYFS